MLKTTRLFNLILVSISFVLISNLLIRVLSLSSSNLGSTDFYAYLASAHIVKDWLGEDLYTRDTQTSAYYLLTGRSTALHFLYLPYTTFIFLPFTAFDVATAYRLFFILNFILMIFVTAYLGNFYKEIKKLKMWFLIPFSFLPVIKSLELGQASIILLCVFLLTFHFLNNRNYFVVGYLAAFLTLKLQYIFFIPFLFIIVDKKAPFVKGLLISAGMLFLWSVAIARTALPTTYISYTSLIHVLSMGKIIGFNYSDYRLLNEIIGIDSIQLIFLINTFFFIISYLLINKYKNTLGMEVSFIIALIICIIFSSHTMDTDLVLLLIPFFYLINSYILHDNVKQVLLLVAFTFVYLYIPYLPFLTTALSPIFLILLIYLLIKRVYFN